MSTVDENSKSFSPSENDGSLKMEKLNEKQSTGEFQIIDSASVIESSGSLPKVMEEKDNLLFESHANANLSLVMPHKSNEVSEKFKAEDSGVPSATRRKTIDFSPRAKEVKISPTAADTPLPERTTSISIWGDEVATSTNNNAVDPDDDTLVYVVNSGIEMLENSATALEAATVWLDETSAVVENETYALMDDAAAFLSTGTTAVSETASWFASMVSSTMTEAMGMDESQIDTSIETTVSFEAPKENVITDRVDEAENKE